MKLLRPRGCGRAAGFALGVLAVLVFSVPVYATRTELDLGGTWQYQKVPQLSYPPSNNWQNVAVPGFLSGWQYEHAWFRRTFPVPARWPGPG